MSHPAALLLAVLFGSAVVEFALLRVFIRLGPVLPGGEALLPVYRAAEGLGLVALNLGTLAAAALVAVAAAGLDWARPRQALAGVALLAGALVNLGLGGLLALAPGPAVVVAQAGGTLGAAALLLAAQGAPPRTRLALGLVASALGLGLYYSLAQGAAGLGLALPGGGLAPFLAEACALAAALALPWGLRPRPTRVDLGVGLGLALAWLGFDLARHWIAAAMAMWTLSFSLFLPGPLYALGLGSATAGLLALRRQAGPAPAAGLLLVFLAGLRLDFSYFALLALAGLAAHAAALASPLPAGAGRGVRLHAGG